MKFFVDTMITILIAAVLYAAHLLEVWIKLGAHPFWSASATQIGLGIGLGAIVLTWQKPGWGVLALLLLLTWLAFQTSTIAKVEFVGSYAENRFAGTVWFYGFVFFIAGLFAFLSGLLRRLVLGISKQ